MDNLLQMETENVCFVSSLKTLCLAKAWDTVSTQYLFNKCISGLVYKLEDLWLWIRRIWNCSNFECNRKKTSHKYWNLFWKSAIDLWTVSYWLSWSTEQGTENIKVNKIQYLFQELTSLRKRYTKISYFSTIGQEKRNNLD